MSGEVRDRVPDPHRVVSELSQSRVTRPTEDRSDATGAVVVIHVGRVGAPAYRTDSTLFLDQRLDILCADAIPPGQVIVARIPVKPLHRFSGASVVAGFAVTVEARRLGPVLWKVLGGFDLAAVCTPGHDASLSLPGLLIVSPTKANNPRPMTWKQLDHSPPFWT